MTSVTEVSLVSGSVPTVLLVLGILGALWLLIARSRRYLLWAVPICLLVAAVLTLLLYWIVEKVWRPFPDPIETQVYVYIGVGLAALLLMVPRIVVARRWHTRILGVLATLVVLACVGAQVNVVFAYYPTVGDALGISAENRIAFAEVPGPVTEPVSGRPLEQHWNPPPGQPELGRITEAPIPGTASGFDARPAQIYLPPAYFTDPRPLLPVLVLLAGQPGEPSDWLKGGELVATMNTYALQHKGLAPVVVVADATGSAMANPLCVNSSLGNVDTYLATDVPTWIKANLQVNTDPSAWAIGGLSYGGTCALQMATNHPDVYPTFIDLSGQLEPTLGDRQRTLDAAFGGSAAAFERVNPMDLMSHNKYPNSAGAFVVGADDDEYRDNLKKVYETAKAAGMNVTYTEVPGGHSFAVWSAGLRKSMDWLGAQLGITA